MYLGWGGAPGPGGWILAGTQVLSKLISDRFISQQSKELSGKADEVTETVLSTEQ